MSWPGSWLHFTFRALRRRAAGSQAGDVGRKRRQHDGAAHLHASQAVFCFRGGGRVLASSWIWFCMVVLVRLKAPGGG